MAYKQKVVTAVIGTINLQEKTQYYQIPETQVLGIVPGFMCITQVETIKTKTTCSCMVRGQSP